MSEPHGPLHGVKVKPGRVHRLVVAGAVHHAIKAVLQGGHSGGGLHVSRVRHIQRQRHRARVLRGERVQRLRVARRDDHPRALRVQHGGGGAADAAGGADQPDTPAAPALHGRVQRWKKRWEEGHTLPCGERERDLAQRKTEQPTRQAVLQGEAHQAAAAVRHVRGFSSVNCTTSMSPASKAASQ